MLKNLHLRALAILTLAIFAPSVYAQSVERHSMLLGNKTFLLFRKEVKEDLQIDAAQTKKIEQAFGDCVQVDGDKIMVRLTGNEDIDDMAKTALAALTAGQLKRLDEVWYQEAGFMAVTDAKTAKTLGVNAAQAKKIEALMDRAGEDQDALFGNGPPSEETMKKVKELRAKLNKDIGDVLTEDQRKAFEAMKGKPMKKKDDKGGG